MNYTQLRNEIIEPVLDHLEMGDTAAADLMLATAIVESGCDYIKQLGGGPALSFWQVEPATHDDIWQNYLAHREHIARAVEALTPRDPIGVHPLIWNMGYACAIARLVYRRRPEPLPERRDAAGMAMYWKQWYNTAEGAGDPDKFERLYRKHILGEVNA